MNTYPMPGPGQNGMMPNHPMPAPQPGPQPQSRSMTALGVTALVLGIIAILTSFIPIVNNLSFIVGLLGFILGIIGLVACVRGTKSGKGIAIAGVVLCALSLVIVLVTQSMFSAALDQSVSSANLSSASSSSISSASSASAANLAPTAKYVVSIDDCTLGTDYQGQNMAIITFTFSNDSDADTSFMVATNAQAFQNGVQLDSAISMDVDSSATMKEIKPGATITVQKGYVLSDMSPLTVEVEELLSFDDDKLAEKTFTLQ